MSVSIAVIGECMLELTQAPQVSNSSSNGKPMNLNYGGDTLNTAVYLARKNTAVSYMTALGDDGMSDWLLEQWSAEGVDCSQVRRQAGGVPGMYLVTVAADGERSFLYWRKNSPASQMFVVESAAQSIAQSLAEFEYVYLSGISLAILDADSLERLFGILEAYRADGGKVVFDGNYRPLLWPSVDHAKTAYQRMYRMTDIALPTLEDEAELFGYESAAEVMRAAVELGVKEVVVKQGALGCLSYFEGVSTTVDAQKVKAIDTTAAGDSFNAGYLAARLAGDDVISACRAGHELAGKVVQCRGAIIPI